MEEDCCTHKEGRTKVGGFEGLRGIEDNHIAEDTEGGLVQFPGPSCSVGASSSPEDPEGQARPCSHQDTLLVGKERMEGSGDRRVLDKEELPLARRTLDFVGCNRADNLGYGACSEG